MTNSSRIPKSVVSPLRGSRDPSSFNDALSQFRSLCGGGAEGGAVPAGHDRENDRDQAGTEPGASLAIWNGLLDGSWRLVQAVDIGGFRFLLARNAHPRSRRKTQWALKRRIVRYAAMGFANKYIAIELGLSPSTVAFHLKNALSELGLASRVELLRVLHASAASDSVTGVAS